MAPYDYSLAMTTDAAYADGRIDPGQAAGDGPATFARAAPVVNYGLLLGELLTVNTAPAVELLELTARAAALRREIGEDDAERLFYGDDLVVLRDTFAAVAAAGQKAVDAAGRPTAAAGARLTASPDVRVDEHGQAVIGTRRIRVLDLVDQLSELAAFLDAAHRYGLTVVAA